MHGRHIDRLCRGASAADREAEEGGVTSSLNTGGRNYREFGRDVDDIIAEVIQVGGPANQTPLEVSVRQHMSKILDDRRDRELTDELLKEIADTLDERVGTYSLVPWQWVMFAEPARDGAEFLGVYITRAFSFEHAVFRAHVTGLSPGGHADGAALPLGLPIDPGYCDRLLTFCEAQALRDVLDGMYN
ncbi:MAG: hypothetical protein ACJAVC_002032 [Brevundimonas sp.]